MINRVPHRGWAIPLLFFLAVGSNGCTSDQGRAAEAEEEAELAIHMANLQRWSHKTVLALDARNPALSDFYLHEVEETIETIQVEAPSYEGHPVAKLTEQLLVPRVEALDRALDERTWSVMDARVRELARACNQCHARTDHGFVRVDFEDLSNPYAQDFSPAE